MQRIMTVFDYSCVPPIPLRSIIVTDKVISLSYYEHDTGLTITDIKQNMETMRQALLKPSIINDFKTHMSAFKLDRNHEYTACDIAIPELRPGDNKAILINAFKQTQDIKPQPWQLLLCKAAQVYNRIDNRIINDSYKRVPIYYSLNTATGRSKTLGWNLQGSTNKDHIKPFDSHGVFIHLDWISADLRMASYISGDPRMEESFKLSDPYTYVAEYLNDDKIDRAKCKIELLSALYSLNFTSPIFDMFPVFRQAMIKLRHEINLNGYSKSLLDRKFIHTNTNLLTIFNAQFQGSVAHAMQAALVKIDEKHPDLIFGEIHDSVVLFCREESVGSIIRYVRDVMIDPLAGWCSPSPRMPFKISIGNKWREWKLFREYR